jgi:E3 ubiquitin-protein ligase HERC2
LNYSAAITKFGELYTWGSGEFGRLGYLDEKRQTIPRMVTELKAYRIIKVSLGFYHAAAVDDQGTVFTWGRGI